MDKEIILLPEQAKYLEQKIEELNNKRRRLIEMYKNNNIGNSTKDKISNCSTSNYEDTLHELDIELNKLEEILKVANFIKETDGEVIEIGTRFSATLDYEGEMETDEYVLVSTRTGSSKRLHGKVNEAIYITPDSPLGKAVIGKRIGDPIYYQINNIQVVGFIEDITPMVNNEKQFEKTK